MTITAHIAPSDLETILFHATQDDMPAGFTLVNADRSETTGKRIMHGEQIIAHIHKHWRQDDAKFWSPFELREQEPRICEMMRRIARTVEERLNTSVSDAVEALRRLNLD